MQLGAFCEFQERDPAGEPGGPRARLAVTSAAMRPAQTQRRSDQRAPCWGKPFAYNSARARHYSSNGRNYTNFAIEDTDVNAPHRAGG